MIELPRRSVTRFFIPLIDVLTLMFCIFLLMPVVKLKGDLSDAESSEPGHADHSLDRQQVERERRELDRLRREARRLAQAKVDLEKRLADLQDAGDKQLAFRALDIGDDGRLFFYDSKREADRRIEITEKNVGPFIAEQKRQAGKNEIYFLLVYPRPDKGAPAFPLRSQREEYDRWFRDVAHSYDVR